MCSPKDLRKEFSNPDAKKVFAGLFHKDPARAEKDAVINFATSLELVAKSHPASLIPSPAGPGKSARADGGTDRTGPCPMVDYLNRACTVADDIEFERTALRSMLGFESMLHDPSPIGAREQTFALEEDALRPCLP